MQSEMDWMPRRAMVSYCYHNLNGKNEVSKKNNTIYTAINPNKHSHIHPHLWIISTLHRPSRVPQVVKWSCGKSVSVYVQDHKRVLGKLWPMRRSPWSDRFFRTPWVWLNHLSLRVWPPAPVGLGERRGGAFTVQILTYIWRATFAWGGKGLRC